jgi:sugar/nucleoside kinase (ribokinase family)
VTAPGPRVVVAGNLSLDDTINPTGTVLMAPGGDGLYASLGVAAWGLVPTLLTLVGDDYPAEHRGRMAASGIDTSRIRAVAGPTVHYRVTNFADGRREYRWISPENRLLGTSPETADYAALDGAGWLHLAAMPIEAHEVGVRSARAAGLPYSLDPHEEYVRGYEARIQAMVEGSVFLPSELEARLLFPDLEASRPLDVGFMAAERLDDWRPASVVVKLGELGSVVRRDGHSFHVPAPAVPVVDSTGAGDAYAGGFVAGLLATGDPRVAAACGTVVAAETVGRFGALTSAGEPRITITARIAQAGDLLRLLPPDARADLDVETALVGLHALAAANRGGDPVAAPTRMA